MSAFANFKSTKTTASSSRATPPPPDTSALSALFEPTSVFEETKESNPPGPPANSEEDPPAKNLMTDEHVYVRNNCLFGGTLKTFNDMVGTPLLEQFATEYNPTPAGAERAMSGLLLFGPSGTGKTAGAQAIAHKIGAVFYKMSMADLQVRNSMARIDALFDVAEAGPQPAVIFLDEADTLLQARAYARVGHFATRFERFAKNLLVIGATNDPSKIAPKILTGRFERKILVDNPNLEARRALVMKQLAQETDYDMSSGDITYVAKELAGRSAVNIERVVSTAVKRALGGATLMDFEAAMEQEPSDYDGETAEKNKLFDEQHGWRGAW
mgnify:CR=1 FL=1